MNVTCRMFIISWAILFGIMPGVALGGDSKNGEETLNIESRTDVIYYDVTGNGREASFYDDGLHILEELDLRLTNQLNDDWQSKFSTSLRATDTDQFDPEEVSIERLSWTLNSSRIKLEMGDYFANFSQYTMNKGIKGVGVQYNFDQPENKFDQSQTYFRIAAGTFDSQWEYLYKDPDNEPMDRFGGGFRYQNSGDHFMYGLNLSVIDDDENDSNRTSNAYNQYLPAFDWEFREDGITINGEHAYSDTEEETLAGVKDEFTGSAHRLATRAQIGKAKVRIKLERVSSDFRTLAGGATPDRIKAYTKVDYKLSKKWKFFALYDFYENNVDDQLTATSTNQTVEAGVKASRLFDRRSLIFSAALKRKWSEKSDHTVDKRSDRIKLSLSDKISALKYKLRYELNINNDDVSGESPENSLYGLELSSRHRLAEGAWQLRPEFELSRQESENITSGGDDTTENARVRLSLSHRNGANFGVDYSLIKTDPYDPAATSSEVSNYGVYGQLKPKYLGGGTIKLEIRNKDYDFSDNTKDYAELMAKLSLVFRISL